MKNLSLSPAINIDCYVYRNGDPIPVFLDGRYNCVTASDLYYFSDECRKMVSPGEAIAFTLSKSESYADGDDYVDLEILDVDLTMKRCKHLFDDLDSLYSLKEIQNRRKK